MDVIFHGAFIVQGNNIDRYVIVNEGNVSLYSLSTKSFFPVTIKVTGRKHFHSGYENDLKKRVKVTFEDGEYGYGDIFWSEDGNTNRLESLKRLGVKI